MVKRMWPGILACVFLLGFTGCSRAGGELSTADVQELLGRFSRSPLGLTVTADDSAVDTEPLRGESGRFIVRISDPGITFNTRFLRELDDSVPLIELPMEAEELVLIYGPDDDYCALRSAAGVTMIFDESLFEQLGQSAEIEGDEELPQGKMTYRIGRIESNDHDMSLLLDPEERGIQETLVGLLGANPSMQSTMTDIQLDVIGKDDEGRVNVTIDEFKGLISVHPDLMELYLGAVEEEDSISTLFEQQDPFTQVDYKLSGIRASLSTPEDDVDFNLKGIAINYSAVPTAEGSTFRIGFDWDVRGMRSEGFKEKEVSALTQINRLNLGFSIDGLPAGFLEAYMKLITAAQSFGEERDPPELEGLQMEAMGLAGQVMQAKPIINLKISPLDHAYGRLDVDAGFRVVGMRPPVGMAKVTFSNIHALAESLERDQILTPDRLEAFVDWLGQMFEIDESGEGVLTFEIKEDDPSHFYLNGKPQKFE